MFLAFIWDYLNKNIHLGDAAYTFFMHATIAFITPSPLASDRPLICQKLNKTEEYLLCGVAHTWKLSLCNGLQLSTRNFITVMFVYAWRTWYFWIPNSEYIRLLVHGAMRLIEFVCIQQSAWHSILYSRCVYLFEFRYTWSEITTIWPIYCLFFIYRC